ncbi:MAG TPA: MBL fold metallo-hydrolase [Chloroflexaceae bacterium]|nr:MBL fold metallo-hydrolase [Chloroflexaceae bacterium]
MRITLFGAAGEVTGSAYLVETARARVLVDFGMFQGGRDDDERNVVPRGLAPRQLDAVVLTHAHIDHTGRLPLLPKAGFTGPVFGTAATLETAELLLEDSARLQAGDLRHANRRRERAGLPLLEPPYDEGDVAEIVGRFRSLPYDQPVEVAPGVRVELVEAGHVLGSASIRLTTDDGDREKIVVFSGDVGPSGAPLLRDPGRLEGADLVFLEATYGDRDHRPFAETEAEFAAVIAAAVARRGKILIPSFAVGRAQAILFYLAELFRRRVVAPFPIYLDSPLAIKATRIYSRHPELADEDWDEEHERRRLRRDLATLELCETADESRALNDKRGPCAIIAGSGMCTGGRILHHLRHNLWRRETAVLIVGYQGVGTLGRALVDGVNPVTIFGEPVAVRASIHTINGLSAHAGQSELLAWLAPLAAGGARVALTHGEERGRAPLARLIEQRHRIACELPAFGETIVL